MRLMWRRSSGLKGRRLVILRKSALGNGAPIDRSLALLYHVIDVIWSTLVNVRRF